MKSARSWLPIAAYSETFNADTIISTIKSGVIDCLPGALPGEVMKKRIAAAMVEADPIRQKYAARSSAWSSLSRLTPKEQVVLSFLTDGLTSKEIAREMDVSPRTVEIHRRNILRKLEVKSTVNAILLHHQYRERSAIMHDSLN